MCPIPELMAKTLMGETIRSFNTDCACGHSLGEARQVSQHLVYAQGRTGDLQNDTELRKGIGGTWVAQS